MEGNEKESGDCVLNKDSGSGSTEALGCGTKLSLLPSPTRMVTLLVPATMGCKVPCLPNPAPDQEVLLHEISEICNMTQHPQ